MNSRKIIKYTLVCAGIVIVIGYSFLALKDIIRGPRIELATPQSGYATTTPLIVVSGRMIRGSNLTLNDATTTVDLAGNFKESLLLSPGYNIMTLEATDRYGRATKEQIELTLLRQEHSSTATTTEIFNNN